VARLGGAGQLSASITRQPEGSPDRPSYFNGRSLGVRMRWIAMHAAWLLFVWKKVIRAISAEGAIQA
jgi:hypothetical protein